MRVIDWLMSNGEFIIGAMFAMIFLAITVVLWIGVFVIVQKVFL